MYAAVGPLYRDGIWLKAQKPLVGQLRTAEYKTVPILNLWPVDWFENPPKCEPLALLWWPTIARVGQIDLLFRGLEAIDKGRVRRWVAQKWRCDTLTYQSAKGYFVDRRYGELEPYRRQNWQRWIARNAAPHGSDSMYFDCSKAENSSKG